MSDFSYLVTYGRGEHLGRFSAAVEYHRGDRVAVRTDRGVEAGTVLEQAASAAVTAVGEVLRPLLQNDEVSLVHQRARAAAILADAEASALAAGLPLLFLDGEILLDGTTAILQVVHWADCDASDLFEQLSTRHGLTAKLSDLTAAAPATGVCSTCGDVKSGCDACGTGGGCSTGSCSNGSVKSADKLTAYFAGLRRQMEAGPSRVSLH
jgi:hypothetical protein